MKLAIRLQKSRRSTCCYWSNCAHFCYIFCFHYLRHTIIWLLQAKHMLQSSYVVSSVVRGYFVAIFHSHYDWFWQFFQLAYDTYSVIYHEPL